MKLKRTVNGGRFGAEQEEVEEFDPATGTARAMGPSGEDDHGDSDLPVASRTRKASKTPVGESEALGADSASGNGAGDEG